LVTKRNEKQKISKKLFHFDDNNNEQITKSLCLYAAEIYLNSLMN
jgi:hypothetical protein